MPAPEGDGSHLVRVRVGVRVRVRAGVRVGLPPRGLSWGLLGNLRKAAVLEDGARRGAADGGGGGVIDDGVGLVRVTVGVKR